MGRALTPSESTSGSGPALPTNDDLLTGLRSTSLHYVTSSDSASFATAIAPFNSRIPYIPSAVVYPSSVSDVQEAVRCAASSGKAVSARSGGHGYASYGLGGQDGSLVIDLMNFKDVKVGDDGIAVIGAGTRLGDVALGLYQHKRATAHGTCPYVGIGGHALYGGFGLASRMWGMLLDNVLSLDVVLADGSFVTASETNETDLFWALRGAGPSYGIVTSFRVKTFPAPESNIVFAYKFSIDDPSVATRQLLAFQSFAASPSIPSNLGLQYTIDTLEGPERFSTKIHGVYYGPLSDFHSLFEPFVQELPVQPSNTDVRQLGYLDSLQVLAAPQDLYNTQKAPEYRDEFFAKSIMTPQEQLLTEEAVGNLFDYLYAKGKRSDTKWFVQSDLYGGKTSFVNSIPLSSTAFAIRSSLLSFQLYASSSTYRPPFPTDGVDFVNGMVMALESKMPDTDFGGYVNYVDPTLSSSEWKRRYYRGEDSEHYQKLLSIKRRYDPSNVFTFPQAIGQ